MSPFIVWTTIVGLILILIIYITRMAAKSEQQGGHDVGVALMEFGRAFPDEAIRSLHFTADGSAIFVRLHNNKTGFMRSRRNHYACSIIEPGRVRVTPMVNARGFEAEFLDNPTHNGVFVFAREAEAAEVSLWLLDNYVSVAGRHAEDTDGGPKIEAEGPEGEAPKPGPAS